MKHRDRMPPIPEESLTEEQKAACAAFAGKRGAKPFGPFVALLRSPEVMLRASALGEQLRYRSSLPRALNELLILLTARHWTQQFEWHHHVPEALKAGLAQETIDAVAEGRRPDDMSEREATVYEFAAELYRAGSVSDATYRAALRHFGEQGIVDMTCVCGYYSLLSLVMNVGRTEVPEGGPAPLPPLP
ncbi:MAG TPA: carboxymuconolactone decarboxylase family protein [Alphaproteobacteria bacterium]|nr:carboxymuconolactone decarboxylase family protein [Alphaproteobacteria bacterium]